MKSRKSIEVEEARHPTADMDGYWWELILGILLELSFSISHILVFLFYI